MSSQLPILETGSQQKNAFRGKSISCLILHLRKLLKDVLHKSKGENLERVNVRSREQGLQHKSRPWEAPS
jgi:hypothetical protein